MLREDVGKGIIIKSPFYYLLLSCINYNHYDIIISIECMQAVDLHDLYIRVVFKRCYAGNIVTEAHHVL